MYPTLMIVTNLFQTENDLRRTGFQTFNVDTVEEARATIQDLRGLRVRKPVVLSDVSRLQQHQAVLLKFIEETNLRVIFLASRDNISSVLLSRMKRVMKTPEMLPFERNDPFSIRHLAESEEGRVWVDPEEIVRNCPAMAEFMYRLQRSGLPVKEKLLDLTLGEEK